MKTDWYAYAKCFNEDTEMFFTDRRWDTARACAYCDNCPVKQDCLDAALFEESRPGSYMTWGVRGGVPAKTRRQLITRLGLRLVLCAACGSEFRPRNNTQKYCGERCGKDARNASRRLARAA